MNKKVMISLILIIVVVLTITIGSKFLPKEEDQNSLYLVSTVLKIDDNYVTLQDENDNVYTFLINDIMGLKEGTNIELEYTGSLDKKLDIQKSEVIGYKVLETLEDTLDDLEIYNDNGIFKDFYKMASDKLDTLTLDEKIGQILLVRVPEKNQIEDLIKYHFGGYLLFQRDFASKTKNEVISMINNFQNNANIPLLIAVDEEGGSVSRISSNKNLVETPFKSPRELYKEGGLALIKQDTIKKSEILQELGINLNLAPVVDVSTNEDDYMYKRSLGEDAKTTADFAREVIMASRDKRVSYTLKHFPGYGNNSDTHLGVSVDTRDKETIMNNDILPFQAGINAKAEAVLVSHNIVSAIDKDKPASLSSAINKLLRDDLGFTGIVITDDLSMTAITTNYKNTAVRDAILAGNDLLIVTDYESAIKEIKAALLDGSLTEDMLNKIALRNLAWKFYKGLIVPNQK